MTRNNTPAQLDAIWDALQSYREDITQEDEWDDICTAMAWITEDLGYEVNVETGELERVV